MSEDTTNKNVRNDEIDLLDLFNRMGRTIRKWMDALGRFILISIVFIIKRWLPLGLSILIGVVIALYTNSKSNVEYSSDLIIRNNLVSNNDMILYLHKLHSYCTSQNYPELSEALSLTEKQSININDISGFWMVGQKKDRIPVYTDYSNSTKISDTANYRMFDRMDIRIVTKSKADLDIFRDGIISFINSDSLFRQKNRLRLQQNKDMLARINMDIKNLDSLQKLKLNEESKSVKQPGSAQMIFLQEQKTQLLYTDIHNLYATKRDLEASLGLYSDIITVLSDFTEPEPSKKSGLIYGRSPILLLFSITLIILIILANRKRLLEIYNKY